MSEYLGGTSNLVAEDEGKYMAGMDSVDIKLEKANKLLKKCLPLLSAMVLVQSKEGNDYNSVASLVENIKSHLNT